MGVKFSIDSRVLKRKLRQAIAASPEARKVALPLVVSRVVQRIDDAAPRDTQRYVRGWIMAGREVGVTSLPLPGVRPSKRAEEIKAALLRRAKYWDYIVRRYEAQGRRDKWERKARRKLASAVKALESFTETAIAFNLRGGPREVSIRTKIHGGSGRVEVIGDRTYVELRNAEPHARIVERRFGVLREAQRPFFGLLHRAGDKYLGLVRKASGLARAG